MKSFAIIFGAWIVLLQSHAANLRPATQFYPRNQNQQDGGRWQPTPRNHTDFPPFGKQQWFPGNFTHDNGNVNNFWNWLKNHTENNRN